ncbi:uncharacterized protein LOC34622322 [Cyclospora cayetanensis]|uniref:Uncharacterized protein LOC34622322 n=1 Tax=Cyclospora cayetanensis TaxID=88456 RepID=A0A6P6RTE5_9EIME|nr:uncharacterized protein LOC34622322 [Cyclospora cayetanensis]
MQTTRSEPRSPSLFHPGMPPRSLSSSSADLLQQAPDLDLFLPISVEDLRPKSPALTVSPVSSCLTSQGPLVTPDACPLLTLEADRRVRFRDSDEEWLLTEEVSVASASVRCSEENTAADTSAANAHNALPDEGVARETGAPSLEATGTTLPCMILEEELQEKTNDIVTSHARSDTELQNGSSSVSAAECAGTPQCSQQVTADAVTPRQFWLLSQGSGNAAAHQQILSSSSSFSSSYFSSSSSCNASGALELGEQRARRHTAPGALRTALIRSADGSLQRRRLHSPPCLMTSHPPKSCVRMQSDGGSFPGLQVLNSFISLESMRSSTQSADSQEALPFGTPFAAEKHYGVHDHRLRTYAGYRVSSLVDAVSFGRRQGAYQPQVSQPAALVDIAALDID